MEIFGKKIDGTMILIAVLVIAGISWGLVSVVTGMMTKGNNAVSAQQAVLDKAQYELYNAKVIKGDMVTDCIKKSEKMFPNRVVVNVTTGGGTTNQYGWTSSSTYTPYIQTDPLNNSYINPVESFTASLTINSNDVVTAITFVQQ